MYIPNYTQSKDYCADTLSLLSNLEISETVTLARNNCVALRRDVQGDAKEIKHPRDADFPGAS